MLSRSKLLDEDGRDASRHRVVTVPHRILAHLLDKSSPRVDRGTVFETALHLTSRNLPRHGRARHADALDLLLAAGALPRRRPSIGPPRHAEAPRVPSPPPRALARVLPIRGRGQGFALVGPRPRKPRSRRAPPGRPLPVCRGNLAARHPDSAR